VGVVRCVLLCALRTISYCIKRVTSYLIVLRIYFPRQSHHILRLFSTCMHGCAHVVMEACCCCLAFTLQAVFEDSDEGKYSVVSSVLIAGSPFRTIACDCRRSCEEAVDHCSFCKCACKHCGGSRFAPRPRVRRSHNGSNTNTSEGIAGTSASWLQRLASVVRVHVALVVATTAVTVTLLALQPPHRVFLACALVSALMLLTAAAPSPLRSS
jgi:hypothetical protein